jgi:Haem-binding domain
VKIGRRHVTFKRLLVVVLGGLVVLFAVIQAIPYGRDHTNPPVLQEPRWDSARTRAFAVRSCFDCHSNSTKWRWYSNIAPGSWLIQRDVEGGRRTLNFSEWNRPQDAGIGDIADAIRGGSMPPWFYVVLHSDAGLSRSQQEIFIRGLTATFAASPPIAGSR